MDQVKRSESDFKELSFLADRQAGVGPQSDEHKKLNILSIYNTLLFLNHLRISCKYYLT